ncbi:MAG: hypothetical protein WDM96_01375 [Lacunisphaera sp.]
MEALQEILEKVNAEEVSVLVTAAPLDRRRSFPKWAEANGDFTLVGGGDGEGAEALAAVALSEARAAGVTFGDGPWRFSLTKVGANTAPAHRGDSQAFHLCGRRWRHRGSAGHRAHAQHGRGRFL